MGRNRVSRLVGLMALWWWVSAGQPLVELLHQRLPAVAFIGRPFDNMQQCKLRQAGTTAHALMGQGRLQVDRLHHLVVHRGGIHLSDAAFAIRAQELLVEHKQQGKGCINGIECHGHGVLWVGGDVGDAVEMLTMFIL